MDIEMKECKSSAMKAYGYDAPTKTLRIRFNNGREHDYTGVSQAHFEALDQAESKGTHFGIHIRPHFPQSRAA